jgi:LytS/YehU family sensor histidine kinase
MLLLNVASFIDFAYYASATALLLLLFVGQALELRRSQNAQSAAELRAVQLELELLKQKIQPHFLMNTLTALAEWVESSPQTGVRMIDALAAEFRAVAAMSGRPLVTVREELELCRHHLAVMGFRGNQRFELRTHGVDEQACLPPAVLHTLLENALTHNRYRDGAVFTLDTAHDGDESIYRLHSPREGTDLGGPGGSAGGGTGHGYVRSRLRAAYGDRARFSSAALSSQIWEDLIVVPARAAP